MKLLLLSILLTTGLTSFASPLKVTATENITVTRGDSAALSCSASGGCPPYKYEWRWSGAGDASAKKEGSSVSVKVLQGCDATVTVTDDEDATASATTTIVVEKRDWTVVHTTNSDAWTNWGNFPFTDDPDTSLGRNVNANNDSQLPIIGETEDDWSDQITRVQVNDPNGPFDKYWYNSTHNLRVERETKINQYLGGQVSGECFNWVTLQNFVVSSGQRNPAISASAVRAGVVAHENAGVLPPNFSSTPKTGGIHH